MNRAAKLSGAIAVLVSISAPSWAGGPGTTASNFLKIGAGTRAVGMGETFVGTADDVSALYWNPAGLAQLGGWEFQGMGATWMLDTYVGYLAAGGPVGGAGTFALSVTTLSSSGIPGYEVDGGGGIVETGDQSVLGLGAQLGWSQRLDTLLGLKDSLDVAIGLAVKMAMQNLAGGSDVGAGLDVGGLWRITDNFQIGMALADMGAAQSGYGMPFHFRLGASFIAGGLLARGDRLTAGTDVTFWVDDFPKFHLGLEYAIPLRPIRLAVRTGYKIINVDLGPASGITVGAGLALITAGTFEAGVDYALVPYGELGITHRVSLALKF